MIQGVQMFQYDDEDITLCVNCDAEYTVTKIDDDDQDPEFCPFCGYHQIDEEEDEDLDDEEGFSDLN